MQRKDGAWGVKCWPLESLEMRIWGFSARRPERRRRKAFGCCLLLVLSTLILRDWFSRAQWEGGFPWLNDSKESEL